MYTFNLPKNLFQSSNIEIVFMLFQCSYIFLLVLGFNDMSTLVGHFVLSLRERKKRDSRGDEREGQGRKRKLNENEETEETRNVSI